MEPEYLAVGGIEERHAKTAKVEWAQGDSLGVPLGLQEDALGAEAQFLGLNNAEQLAIDDKGVVGGSFVRGEFLDGVVRVRG